MFRKLANAWRNLKDRPDTKRVIEEVDRLKDRPDTKRVIEEVRARGDGTQDD